MKIALCVIATGKYGRFLGSLLPSVGVFFCPQHEVEVVLFTDGEVGRICRLPVHVHRTAHEAWPGPALHRHDILLQAESRLVNYDYVFYSDADMLFAGAMADEILGAGLTATLHPGFAGRPRGTFTYETRPASAAYIRPDEGTYYFCSGFQGGRAAAFLQAARHMADAAASDSRCGITAIWHDESHWNRYLIDHPPETILSPLYCSPQSWNVSDRKLIALDKNHAEMRS